MKDMSDAQGHVWQVALYARAPLLEVPAYYISIAAPWTLVTGARGVGQTAARDPVGAPHSSRTGRSLHPPPPVCSWVYCPPPHLPPPLPLISFPYRLIALPALEQSERWAVYIESVMDHVPMDRILLYLADKKYVFLSNTLVLFHIQPNY